MYKKKSSGWAKHFDFIVLDLLCLHLSFTLAYILRHGIANPYGDQLYRNMAIFITFADITVLFFFETLKGVLKRGYYKEFNPQTYYDCFSAFRFILVFNTGKL